MFLLESHRSYCLFGRNMGGKEGFEISALDWPKMGSCEFKSACPDPSLAIGVNLFCFQTLVLLFLVYFDHDSVKVVLWVVDFEPSNFIDGDFVLQQVAVNFVR